jgi:hypothetical protein
MGMGWNMHRNSIGYSHHKYALSGLALTALIFAYTPAHADQQIESINPYSTVDPFDPSEMVTNILKDDFRLRLRLPAPDLPLSVVDFKQPKPMSQSAITSPESETQATPEAMTEPGILSKSINTVMSIFDWSNDSKVAAKALTPEKSPTQSDEPIRINVHVGIKKPQTQPLDETSDNEVSSLQTPWSRNQERVRQFFTFGEIKTHD